MRNFLILTTLIILFLGYGIYFQPPNQYTYNQPKRSSHTSSASASSTNSIVVQRTAIADTPTKIFTGVKKQNGKTTISVAVHTNKMATTATGTPPVKEKPLRIQKTATHATSSKIVISRIPRYTIPPIAFETLNETVHPAVVNILCGTHGGSPITGITGSGVIIDPRGIILTNAHVAQYLLLQNLPSAKVSCVIRIGAPARTRYIAEVFAFPGKWAKRYAKEIRTESPTGTGEDDWALLYITKRTNSSKKPSTFPFVSFDTRQAVTVTNDIVLLVGYPAGFLGGTTLLRNLWPSSAVVNIHKVYTFTKKVIDIVSLGGSVVAQGGASGGAVVNKWGKLVGIVVTSSAADTTGKRDLRAVTLSHIDTSIKKSTGKSLRAILKEGNFAKQIKLFNKEVRPNILKNYIL